MSLRTAVLMPESDLLRTDVLIPESDLFPVRCLDSSFSFFDLDRVFYNNIMLSSPSHVAAAQHPRR